MRLQAQVVTARSRLGERLVGALAFAGCEAGETMQPAQVEARLRGRICDLLVVTRRQLGARPGEAVGRLRRLVPGCEVVVVQAREDGEERAALLAGGAFGVVSETLSGPGLGLALGAYVGRLRERLHREHRSGPDPAGPAADPEPRSPAMRELLRQADRAAVSRASILLLGETGVGKGWLARRIHRSSGRGGPFVAVNCGAVPESLWESELFGHERGAFTGADRARRGRFEAADGGTLFLDEIGETPAHLQVKLLRALETGEVQRLGGERPIAVDVRIVAATNRDLERETLEGRFREDLWYRLAVLALTVPPLRDRREDVGSLAQSLLAAATGRAATPVEVLSPDTLRALRAYDWPGNVRELANVIERAVLLAEGPVITPGELPLRIAAAARAPAAVSRLPASFTPNWLDRSLADLRAEVVHALEREYLRAQLARTGGHLAEAARRAGIDRRSLHRKMAELGLDKAEFKQPRPRVVRGSG